MANRVIGIRKKTARNRALAPSRVAAANRAAANRAAVTNRVDDKPCIAN